MNIYDTVIQNAFFTKPLPDGKLHLIIDFRIGQKTERVDVINSADYFKTNFNIEHSKVGETIESLTNKQLIVGEKDSNYNFVSIQLIKRNA